MNKDTTGKKPTVFLDLSIFRIQKSPKALIELASQEISDASSNEISLNIVDTSGTQAGFNVDLHAKRLEYSKRILIVVHKPELIYPLSLIHI